MAGSDLKAKRVTTTGAFGVGRARVRQLQVTVGAGTGRVTLTDGDGGETVLDLDFAASDTHSVNIPAEGILFTKDPFLSAATNVDAVTLFYA
ncbi:MAG: hypothetical protein RI553_11235 [Salibaculum sp.]|uniref:hypothetical protein n=1 Tax=Salibaculum sp. TaxID=2855480 RepID=UPI00286FEE5E|nr:hypothetical protein [Salibaculum sp.]MDR9428666.1 hypothetical protein [Salibaculum sp.]